MNKLTFFYLEQQRTLNLILNPSQQFLINFSFVMYFFFSLFFVRVSGKHRKILQADENDLEEAQTIASQSTTNQNQRDIEAGRKRN